MGFFYLKATTPLRIWEWLSYAATITASDLWICCIRIPLIRS